MTKSVTKTLAFSGGDVGEHHYRQWRPAKPIGWLHIMHGMAEHSARYADLAGFLNKRGVMVTAGDHRGHGLTGSSANSLYHFADNNGWTQMLDDQWQLITHIAKRQKMPLIILGHSMGSFMANHFCQRYGKQLNMQTDGQLCGLILSASNYDSVAAFKVAAAIARVERHRLGPRNMSPILEQLSFGTFNRAFKPNRTTKDWLSSDPSVVDSYIADPWCGGPISTQSWYDFLTGLAELTCPKALSQLDSNLPVYLIAGNLDPVGKQGKGVIRLKEKLLQAGSKQVDLRLYQGGRHEMLNETNHAEVYQDIDTWLQTYYSRG
jgi:alpha-beta hydrolase superfamily lysophospholipase